MAGTGMYWFKTTPVKRDDTQNGAPSGQTIPLTTGGLGTADAFIGGYVENVTRSEIRSIVSHTDDSVDLEGNLTNWLNGDDLDIYDSWSTPQAAADQLDTDQGGTLFADTQYLRGFAGTFGAVAPNAALNPDFDKGKVLVIEGDPADARANIILTAAGSTHTVLAANAGGLVIRHLKITNTGTGRAVWVSTGYATCVVLDCYIESAANGAVYSASTMQIENSEIKYTGTTTAVVAVDALDIRGCQIDANNATAVTSRYAISIEGSEIHNANIVVHAPASYGAHTPLRIANCTCYDASLAAITLRGGPTQRVIVTNTIFKDITTVWNVIFTGCFPCESGGCFGPQITERNNAYHGYTRYASDGTTHLTAAEWAALDRVDAEGIILEDPLLIDPASGNFGLQATSPCRRAGRGSEVLADYRGVPFDAHYPDIGAWSGIESLATPVWPSSLPQNLDQPQYQEAFPDVVERTQMDSGPAKVRRRFTGGYEVITGTMTLTIAQAAALETFFNETTAGGSLSFQWTHPRTGTTIETRFVGPPTLAFRGPRHFTGSLALEVLP